MRRWSIGTVLAAAMQGVVGTELIATVRADRNDGSSHPAILPLPVELTGFNYLMIWHPGCD